MKIGLAFTFSNGPLMTEIYSVHNFDAKRAVGRLLTRVHHLFLERVGERLSALDLTPAQWGIVVALAEGAASTPSELSRALNYDAGAMTRLIDRLELKGFVRRLPSTEDRRSVSVQLTERGKVLPRHILPLILAVHNELLIGFSKEEADQLESILARMLQNGNKASHWI